MGGRWCRGIQACSLEVVQEWWLNCLVVLASEPAGLLVQHLLECGYSLNIENNLKCSTKLQLHWAYCGKHCLNVLRYYLVKVCCKLQYSRHCLWRASFVCKSLLVLRIFLDRNYILFFFSGKGAVYSFDPVGSYQRDSFKAAGSASAMLQPLLDNQVK